MSRSESWKTASINFFDRNNHLRASTCTWIMKQLRRMSLALVSGAFVGVSILTISIPFGEGAFDGLYEVRNLLIGNLVYAIASFAFVSMFCTRHTWVSRRVPEKYDFFKRFRNNISTKRSRFIVRCLSRFDLALTVVLITCVQCMSLIPQFVLLLARIKLA